MAGVFRVLQNSAIKRSIILSSSKNIRSISTSKKNRETASVADTVEKSESTEHVADTKKNWVSYGFNFKSEQDDKDALHSSFFFSITICIVFGGLLLTYYPDVFLRDWAQREAYLELRRREEQGLPLIDRNLIDPSKFELPSDEELGDTEIII
ncbi:hypothetical protein ANN_17183 [Periplaneta americana]|uniref:NADH dehydrogenase [ubiquinone] 1 beta subcomplex subunit 11, mitochondrial n=1 Tax=Periplaneta americana TaxID=6978 RepID=A0ABQ8SS77_PERAM|nr:hypothetical protein ANN_17183 [Periplaneta americana]